MKQENDRRPLDEQRTSPIATISQASTMIGKNESTI
jgi:hypothetical protein